MTSENHDFSNFTACLLSTRLRRAHLIMCKFFLCRRHKKTYTLLRKRLACEPVIVGADLSRTPPIYRPLVPVLKSALYSNMHKEPLSESANILHRQMRSCILAISEEQSIHRIDALGRKTYQSFIQRAEVCRGQARKIS
jgi:hypothetical protein